MTLLALEWANFVLTIGFVFLRVIKLVISACAYIGRIDTPFLAEGVGKIGPILLDSYPFVFVKDLLQHEAHRHPYMELLGKIYLLKLKHGVGFGSRAGSAWRLLFAHALMPWLHKYRIFEDGGDGNTGGPAERSMDMRASTRLLVREQTRRFSLPIDQMQEVDLEQDVVEGDDVVEAGMSSEHIEPEQPESST